MHDHNAKGLKKPLHLIVVSAVVISVMVVTAWAFESPLSHEEPYQWSSAIVDHDDTWFQTAQARKITDNLLHYQSKEGGWPKNVNMAIWPPAPKDVNFKTDGRANTFDNDGTTVPMIYLARIYSFLGKPEYRAAFERGLDYTLKAQYPNGGWPQFYPLRDGYYTHITFNDDAMIQIMFLLKNIVSGNAPFQFVDEQRRLKAKQAIDKGLEIILQTQIKQKGQLTVWCAQYDEDTLAPAWARAYEPPSLSGNESVGILRYLMSLDAPSPAVVAAIEGGINWLQNAAIQGVELERFIDQEGRIDTRVVHDLSAPPIWARFYEQETNKPLFLGRDSVYRYAFDQIEHERRNGYHYYGYWPSDLLKTDYPEWRSKHGF